ncbi:hypothetical protein HK100_006468 [Physocladia obscura]|uniref:General negative regulator of transcription subunit 1 n=1 Tax=Physocladia obscura TaxID=109957 RepID=A0AAD5TC57_9FUNG|nr:hypothetical protein HK100_006468 [Physocladia obscura]
MGSISGISGISGIGGIGGSTGLGFGLQGMVGTVVLAVGYQFTASRANAVAVLTACGVRNEAGVARALAAMAAYASTPTATTTTAATATLPSPTITSGSASSSSASLGAKVGAAGIEALRTHGYDFEAASASASGFDFDLFVFAVSERVPNADWATVVRGLDCPEAVFKDIAALSTVVTCFKSAIKDIFKFPISAFFGRWQYSDAQIGFLKLAIFNTPELFSFPVHSATSLALSSTSSTSSTSISPRRVLPDSTLVLGKQLPHPFLNLPWNSLDLIETLIHLADLESVFADVKALLDVAVREAPELLLLGLAQITPPWNSLHKEVASALVIMFLAGNNNNSSFVVPLLWQVSPTLVLAGLVHIYSKDPSQLSRILDIIQEIRALSPILDSKHTYFNLDLVSLASRRGYVNLEKWLQERIQLDSRSVTVSSATPSFSFVKGCLEFISDKITLFAAGSVGGSGGGPNPLPVEIVATFLRVLRTSPMSPELAAYFKELLVVSIKVYPQLMGGVGGSAIATAEDILISNIDSGVNGNQSDAEKEASLYYSRLLKSEISIPQIVDLLQRCRDSVNPREQEVFVHFTQIHLEEYKCFPQYPDKQLQITSTLFGALIQDVYVDAKNLASSLRCVLDALRQPPGSKFFKFGIVALLQFQGRLGEWPHYCSLLLQIPHLAQNNPEIVAYVTPLATVTDGMSGGSSGGGGGGGGVVGNTSGVDSGDGDSVRNITETAASGEKHVFTALKLDSDDEAENGGPLQEPDPVIKDKILFIINNITFDNLESKVDEMKEILNDSHFRWFSEYLVVKRASIEPNFHQLYIALLESLQFPPLMKKILVQTYANIRVLLNSDKTVTSSSERTLLKNLGTWLGSVSLAKNKPIKHKNLAFKNLLLEGFESDRLIVVIPFVCKVLEQCHNSKVFRPPNPWLMAIMKLLSELYHFANLKLNLKFEIEVLCKKLQLDVKDIEPAVILRNQPLKVVQKKVAAAIVENSGIIPSPVSVAQQQQQQQQQQQPQQQQSIEESSISLYITLPNLPIFNQQPSMKRVVHIAIDRAIREVIDSAVVERSVSIACITTRELILKDFAKEVNEEKMRRAAHLMAQNLAGSLAIVSSRDPLRVGMITQLQNLLRQNGMTEQSVSEQVVFLIVNDNLELACTVMERAAAEKSLAEIDDLLAPAYLQRRKHRERSGAQFFDISVYSASTYPSSLPEPLKLKNEVTPNQFRVYEDFSRMSTRQIPFSVETDTRDARNNRDSITNTEDHLIPPVIIQAMEKLDLVLIELDKSIASATSGYVTFAQLPGQHEVKVLLRQISAFISSFSNRDDIHLLAGQKVVHQLFQIDSQLSRESYTLLLERICDLSKRTAKEITNWFLYSKDDRRWNVPVLLILIRVGLLPVTDLDVQLARMVENNKPGAIEFVVELIKAVLLDEVPFAAHDSFFNCIAVLSTVTEMNAPGVVDVLKEIKNRFSVMTLKSATSGRELDSMELRESFIVLFSEWVKIFHHPASDEKAYRDFIIQLQNLGVLDEEDTSSLFFRVCTELSVDLYIQAKANPGILPFDPFQAVDAFSRLIVLLVRYHAEPAEANSNTAKLDLTTKILYIIVLVSVHAHEQRRAQFNQRPFFRLFSSLLNDLNLFEDQLQDIYFPILFKIRFFMSKLLSAESQKGWPFFQRLLVDLFKFLGPFLRQSEMADAIRLLYKATLRILLVLLHDFPEFLCDYHFSFVEVIPHSCIQLRNLILSAFPRNMRLPDPFTPNLKVDLLPEVNQPPHVMSDYTGTLSHINIKADIDTYLKNRAPASFLSELRTRLLQPQPDDFTKYNLAAINSLVLYVGVQAIANAQAKGLQASAPLTQSAPLDIFQQLIADFDSEGRYLLLSAIANQLRYPNSHTHYFSTVLLYLFAEASEEIIQEQITRVLIERLIVNRPHPYGLLITFIECAPEIERLFSSVAKSIQTSMMRS